MKVHIFWYGFFSEDGLSVSVGGVQTYLINLTCVFNQLGHEVHFYRAGENNIDCVHYNINMHGFKSRYKKKDQIKRIGESFNHYKHLINPDLDIVIFADDLLSVKTKGYHTLALQHGIFWDVPDDRTKNSKFWFCKVFLDRLKGSFKRLIHSTYFDQIVCVDYNYVNWYRTWMPCNKTKLVVNPNFAPIFPKVEKPNDIVNIIFARRFEPFRGTKIFGIAIKRILQEYTNVHVTLAGWGSDEKWLHNQLDVYRDKVLFTTYKSEESFKIHSDKHIAVVPTVGSEGTSLSLLEAMSSQCAVIGSDVGGITNIILDGYNGLMVPAGDSDKLYYALKLLIENPDQREQISQKGYETVKLAFSYDVWRKRWNNILSDYIKSIRT